MIIAIAQVLFRRRRTESLATELQRALRAEGHLAEIARIPCAFRRPEDVLDTMLACRLLGLSSDVLIALEFPASLVPHPRKILWLTADHWIPDGVASDVATTDRLLWEAYSHAFRELIPEALGVFTISATTSHQLRRHADLWAPPLYPPPPRAGAFRWQREEDYLFVPLVFGSATRVDLVLEAMSLTGEPVRARITGDATHLEECRQTAIALGVSERVECLGEVDAGALPELYARCRGVVSAARRDPFPWAALGAMLASKPIVACADAGAAAELVQHERTGLLTDAAPEHLAAAMDALWTRPERARFWGSTGRGELEAMSLNWPTIVNRLLQ